MKKWRLENRKLIKDYYLENKAWFQTWNAACVDFITNLTFKYQQPKKTYSKIINLLLNRLTRMWLLFIHRSIVQRRTVF